MKLHKDSHIDHGLTAKQLTHVLLLLNSKGAQDHVMGQIESKGVYIHSMKLPEELGTVPCGLFGPVMGDAAIPSAWVTMKPRGDRKYPSRVLTKREPVGTDWIMLPSGNVGHRSICVKRTTSEVTVIAGPHDGDPCVLFTIFGGPLTPKEPDDPTLTDNKRAESIAFWTDHALVEV